MKTRIVIPARLKSSRLPKKLIKKINGKTLIEHVFTRAKKIKCDFGNWEAKYRENVILWLLLLTIRS